MRMDRGARNTATTAEKSAERLSRILSGLLCLLLFSFSEIACTNGSMNRLANRSLNNGVITTDPGSSNSGDGSLLNLKQVVRTSADSENSFDLIGDGSGEIGQYCMSKNGSGGSSGPSTCVCSYDFIRSDGSHEKIEADTIYRENNLIRCSSTVLPGGLGYVKVSIKLTNSDNYSNELTFNFLSNGNNLNLAEASSFRHIRRYQCKDAVYIPYLFNAGDGGIYDPIQSEDPYLGYPLNFYTGNLASAIAHFVNNPAAKPSSDGGGWICPTNPNDPAAGMNLNVFSVMPLGASDDYSIFPVSSARDFDRSTFHLAKKSSGVFNVPVNAFIAPSTNTAINTTGAPPPIGYGASPIPGPNDTESCPDASINIPSGYQWVKVWLFRASLEDRKFRRSAKVKALGKLVCNPGMWPGGTNALNDQVFADCKSANSRSISSIDSIASRVMGASNACFNLNDGSSASVYKAGQTTDCSSGTCVQKPAYSSYALGSDIWNYLYSFNGAAGAATGRDSIVNCDTAQDPVGICASSGKGTGPDAVPRDFNPNIASIDNGISRYDYLFVVSPTNIHAKNFKRADSTSLPYTPIRYYTSKDCQGDPDHPAFPGDCSASKMIRYGIKFHDISTNGDDAGRLPVFPVCALQPIAGS